jgi:hypothetical protein
VRIGGVHVGSHKRKERNEYTQHPHAPFDEGANTRVALVAQGRIFQRNLQENAEELSEPEEKML